MSNFMTVGYINNKKLLLKLNNEKEKILNKYKYFSSQEQKFPSQEDFENYIEQKKEMKKGDFILKTLDTELSNFIKLVREFPTEDLTRKAEWGPPSLDDFEYVNPDETVDEDLLVCSHCHQPPLFNIKQNEEYSRYCPNCGSEMEE